MHSVQTLHLKPKPGAREGLAEILTKSVSLFSEMGRLGALKSGLFKVRSRLTWTHTEAVVFIRAVTLTLNWCLHRE